MTRGDVYRLRLRGQRGREQKGVRYAVLLQAEPLLPFSTVIIAPTSRSAGPATFRPVIELDGEKTRVMVEQMHMVDVRVLDRFTTHLTPRELMDIRDALELVLGLR